MGVRAMNINDRLKYLRTEKLKLTTRRFAESINMSGGAITNMEKGTRNITMRTINEICRKYNVSRNWLINGKKPIFEDVTNDLNISDDVKQLMKQYNLLNETDKKLVKEMVDSLADKMEKTTDATHQ